MVIFTGTVEQPNDLTAMVHQAPADRFQIAGHLPAPIHDHDGKAWLDHRYRPMLEICNGPRPSQDVAGFRELEGDLLRRREVEAAAEDDRARTQQRWDEAVQLRLLLESRGQCRWHLPQGRLERSIWIEGLRDQSERQQAGDIGLGCRHAALGPGPKRQDQLGRVRQRGVWFIGDRDRDHALACGLFDYSDHIWRRARLRDADHTLALE